MFSWVKQEQGGRNKDGEMYQTVTEGLQSLYLKKLLPLEETYLFHDFHSPALEAADFQSKPMVLLVGQYSTGKTTFIRYLPVWSRMFPGCGSVRSRTTDGFIAVMYGENEGTSPATLWWSTPTNPSGSSTRSETPSSTGYDFTEVLRWFGERVDRIILLFDAHKLDISDEFSEAIRAFKGQDDKIRVVLNRPNQVDTQQLMRVYGALIVVAGKRLFEAESQDLFKDIQSLPRNAALRKLNDLIKRARLAKVHAYIISHLKKEMPSLFGREKKKEELIMRLPEIYTHLQREHHISPGDFPSVTKMQDMLQHYDFSKFPSMKIKLIESVDKMLATKIAGLMTMIRDEESKAPPVLVTGGAFEGSQDGPFGHGYGEGICAGSDTEDWIVSREKHRYDEIFYMLMPVNGKITGVNAKKEMMNSRLPNTVLGKIWKLADCDKDGMLDDEEFALAQHLMKVKLEGYELPSELPDHLVPPED
ncbi:hypothetical protein KUCAC02_022223 [Chaenocephalus aceratus]|nr:hypothetical protein KUCAC02_022223 [Chaenocephalus aceratus]